MGSIVNADNVVPPASWSLKDVESWLISQLAEIQSSPGKKPVSATADLFEQGLDSLGATILCHRVVGALQASESPSAARLVTPSTIYEHSTVAKLVSFVVGAVVNPERFESVTVTSRADEIERMIKKYSFAEKLPPPLSTVTDKTEVVVLITGTTGNLGAQLVDVFLRDGRVKKVYTLNRPSGGEKKKDIRARHAERFVDKGLDVVLLLDERLVLLEGDASGDHLGLSSEVYEEVCAYPFFGGDSR